MKNFRSILFGGIILLFPRIFELFRWKKRNIHSNEEYIQADVQFTHLGEWERSQGRGSSLLYCVRPDCMTKHKARTVFLFFFFFSQLDFFEFISSYFFFPPSTQLKRINTTSPFIPPLYYFFFLNKDWNFCVKICAVSLRLLSISFSHHCPGGIICTFLSLYFPPPPKKN